MFPSQVHCVQTSKETQNNLNPVNLMFLIRKMYFDMH